ncbi:MAG: WxL domain-containing protein [Clostridioides sp.]|jgi:hypothetical protein|nr:WxL domain-containing protein [Clostridioides sp.]
MNLKKIATLITIAGITLTSSGVRVFADAPAILKSKAKVVFTAPTNPDKPIVDPEDPENPDQGKPDPDPEPGTGGLLSIDHVSNFDFETHEIQIGYEMNFFALPQAWKEAHGLETTKPNYVQVSDQRLTGDGWRLLVKQDEELKTSDNKVLTGAKITVSNIEAVTATATTDQLPIAYPTIEITPSGESKTVMLAEKDKGQGTHLARFGDSNSKGSSVKLTVPSTTTVYAKEYTANLTWTLLDVPDILTNL